MKKMLFGIFWMLLGLVFFCILLTFSWDILFWGAVICWIIGTWFVLGGYVDEE